jgi:hypothetical protein
MTSTSKHARKARLSKDHKGDMAGKDDSKKSPYPHLQAAPIWCTPKSKKGKGKVNNDTENRRS